MTSFGETEHAATLPGGRIDDIVTDPVGRYWVRTADGTVFGGGLWNASAEVATDISLVVRDCEETRLLRSADLAAETTARSLGEACGSFDNGDTDGRINGAQATTERLTRVQRAFGGVLWVDDAGTSGCLGCDARVERTGVKDAIALHLAPFVPGELAWIDEDGGLWSGQD